MNGEIEKEAKKTIELANNYVYEVHENNKRIKKVLDKNSHLIDPDDVELFLLFYEHLYQIY